MLSLIPRLWLGEVREIDYDSFWHVFIAVQSTWEQFINEVRGAAHPPLFYLLLKPFIALSPTNIGYRAVSILSGAGSVYLAGAVVLSVTRSRMAAVIASSILALSWTAIVMNTEIRSYSFLVLLLLAGTWAVVRERMWIAAALFTFAVSSHYSAILYVLALVASFLATRRPWKPLMWVLLPPLVVYAGFYYVHARVWTIPLNHLPSHYYDPAKETLAEFVRRNLIAQAGVFTPRFAPIWVPVTGAIIYLGALIRSWRRKEGLITTLALVPLVLNVGLLLAAIIGKYPFGGAPRQQYFAYVSLLVGAACLMSTIRGLPIIAAAVLVVGTFNLTNEVKLPWWRGTPLRQSKSQMLNGSFSTVDALYTTQYNLIPLFAEFHDWNWEYRGISPDGVVRYYDLSKGNRRIRLYRDFRWTPNLDDPGFYAGLRTYLAASPTPIIVITSGPPNPATEQAIRSAASGQVEIGRVSMQFGEIAFEVIPPAALPQRP